MKKILLALAIIPLLVSVPLALAQSRPSPDPGKALKELKEGNAQFVAHRTTNCGKQTEVRNGLVEGQAPEAIVLSCSDSRVPPEIIFDRNLGQLFTIRVAGNILNDENIASIEYAIAHLGPRLIVVMGHESCGAVKEALDFPKEDAGSPHLSRLVSDIRANLGSDLKRFSSQLKSSNVLKGPNGPKDIKLREPAKKNVASVAAALLKRSAIIRNAVQSGRAKIVQAIYELDTGNVEFWE
jgi:carbonic anhydrase